MRSVIVTIGLVLALVGCSASQDGRSSSPRTAVTPGGTNSSTAPAPPPQLVGRWQRTITCSELVSELKLYRLAPLAPYAWLSQTSSTGTSSFAPGSPKPTEAHPCTGAIPRVHSHFFDATGRFGSLDWLGDPVDDGSYRILDAQSMRIGGVRFKYQITDGDTLQLTPVLTRAMIRQARADPREYSDAGWAVSVALSTHTWHRVACSGWC